MFGHDDNEENKDEEANRGHDEVVVSDNGGEPAENSGGDWQHPDSPSDNEGAGESSTPTPDDETQDETGTHDEHQETHEPDEPASGATNDLIDIKQEALTKLTPLVGHLDQPAEEKFRTLMMMIQASDDQSLVRSAYDTALQIEDEKARAQALLDIVNEINYFTQNPNKPE